MNQSGSDEPLVLVHGDSVLANFLFDKKNSEWELVAVIDWGDSGYGDKRYDLSAMQWSIGYNSEDQEPHDLLASFLKGYGCTTQEYIDLLEMDLYDLYDAFVYDE